MRSAEESFAGMITEYNNIKKTADYRAEYEKENAQQKFHSGIIPKPPDILSPNLITDSGLRSSCWRYRTFRCKNRLPQAARLIDKYCPMMNKNTCRKKAVKSERLRYK